MKSIALSACLIATSPALAGLHITLRPTPDLTDYQSGQSIDVDVFAQLTPSGPPSINVRMFQLDISNSDAAIEVTPVFHHMDSALGPIPFWDFGSATACAKDQSVCGADYFIMGNLEPTNALLNNIVNVTWVGLASQPDFMITLTEESLVQVGSFHLVMPNEPGRFVFSVLNYGAEDPNFGAQLRFGFGSPSDPLTAWSERNGEITGNWLEFMVGVPEPATLGLLAVGAIAVINGRRR